MNEEGTANQGQASGQPYQGDGEQPAQAQPSYPDQQQDQVQVQQAPAYQQPPQAQPYPGQQPYQGQYQQAQVPPAQPYPDQQPYQEQPPQAQPYPDQQPYQEQPPQAQPYPDQQPYQAQAPQAQPYPGQPYQAQPYYGQVPAAPIQGAGNGKVTAALVCGILAILFSGTVLIGVILGIVAIVLAMQYVKSFGKEGKATGAKICGIVGIVFSIIALVSYIVFFVFLAAALEEYESSSYSYSYSYPDSNSGSGSGSDSSSLYGTAEDEQAVEDATEKALQGMANPSQADIDALAVKYEDEFESLMGFSMADAGIDSVSIVKACASTIEYSLDGAYAYTDGTATSYAEVYSCDIWSYLSAFSEELSVLQKEGTAPQLGSGSPDKTRIGELFLSTMDKAESTEKYVMLEFSQTGSSWVVDPDSLEEETDFVFGIYY